jgi:protein phosphatase
MPLRLRAGCCSEQGRYRSNNEDQAVVADWPDAVVCVVADGTGGSDVGRMASERAVAGLLANLDKPARDRADGMTIEGVLRAAFARANDDVLAIQQAQQPPARRGSSTAALLYWRRGEDRVHVAHVGDVRAYHLSGQSLRMLTVIHNIAQALVEAGTISPEQARTVRRNNTLVPFLGLEPPHDRPPDVWAWPIAAGDRFLLCCDGVYAFLEDDAVIALLREDAGPRRRAERLCRVAMDRGSRDNVSCVVVDVIEED